MRPDYRITVGDKDITADLRSRLLSLRVRDAPGARSDEVFLELRDGPTPIDWPPTGAELKLSLGWAGSPLTEMGTYTIMRPEASGPRPTLRVQATAVRFGRGITKPSGTAKAVSTEARTQLWTNTTLGDIARTVAGRLGLTAAVGEDADAVPIDHAEQDGESDIHFVARLGVGHGLVVKIASDRLIVTKHHTTESVSGRELPTITLSQSQALSWSAEVGARDEIGSVVARWRSDEDKGAETAGSGEPKVELTRRFHNADAAKRGAARELAKRRGKGRRFEAELRGRPDIVAGATLSLGGDWRPGVSGDWAVYDVEHQVGAGGWVTFVKAAFKG